MMALAGEWLSGTSFNHFSSSELSLGPTGEWRLKRRIEPDGHSCVEYLPWIDNHGGQHQSNNMSTPKSYPIPCTSCPSVKPSWRSFSLFLNYSVNGTIDLQLQHRSGFKLHLRDTI